MPLPPIAASALRYAGMMSFTWLRGARVQQDCDEAELEERFDRSFAATQVKSDIFGTCVGGSVYLGLLIPLREMQRPDLCMWAVVCALSCLWPTVLSRVGKEAYLQYRDILLLFHFLFHYGVGAVLALHVRLHNKLQMDSPAAFLVGHILSSTVLWQTLDALLYRMRFRHFLAFKPLVHLVGLPLERKVCELTCSSMPDKAHYFGLGANGIRMLLSTFQLLPRPATLGRAPDDHSVSCFKIQAFLILFFAWVLPAFVLHSLEKQSLRKFREQRRQSRSPTPTDTLGDSSSREPAAAASTAAATAAARGSGYRPQSPRVHAAGSSSRRRSRSALDHAFREVDEEEEAAAAQHAAGGAAGPGGLPLPTAWHQWRQQWDVQWHQRWHPCRQREADGGSDPEDLLALDDPLADVASEPLPGSWYLQCWWLPLMMASLCWHVLDSVVA